MLLLEVFCGLCTIGCGLALLPCLWLLNGMFYSLWPLAWLIERLEATHGARGKQNAFEGLAAAPRTSLLVSHEVTELDASSAGSVAEETLVPVQSADAMPLKAMLSESSGCSGPCTKGNSAIAPTSASSGLESDATSGAASGAASREGPAFRIGACSASLPAGSGGASSLAAVPCGVVGDAAATTSDHQHQHLLQHQHEIEEQEHVSTGSSDSNPGGCDDYETESDDEEGADEEVCLTNTKVLSTMTDGQILSAWQHDGQEALGTGGFGVVYRGLLTLPGGRAIEAVAKMYTAAARLGMTHMERESRAMRMLHASGAAARGSVLRMYAAGKHDGRPTLLVELASSCLFTALRGAETRRINAGLTSADAMLMPVAEIVDVLLVVADALTEMHGIGIVHQDIKPENVLYRANGDPCVADMGLAVVLKHGRRAYRRGCGGTSWFSAPEQGLYLPALNDWIRLRRDLEQQQQAGARQQGYYAAGQQAAAAATGVQLVQQQPPVPVAAPAAAPVPAPVPAAARGPVSPVPMAPYRPQRSGTEDETETEGETQTETEESSEGSSEGMDLGSSLEGSGASEFESGSDSDSDSDSGGGASQASLEPQQDQPALTPAVDVWALGMLGLCLAVTGNAVQAGAFHVLRKTELPGYVPAWLSYLIRDCTEWEPSARPTAAQALARLKSVKASLGRA